MAAEDADARDQQDQAMAEIARQTAGTLRIYPRPGRAVRRVVLRDSRGDRGSQLEATKLEDDGTLRITGNDQGPGVTEFFGEGITSCGGPAWSPATGLPASCGSSAARTMTTCSPSWPFTTSAPAGQLSDMLNRPEVAADFDNWHS